MNIPIPKHKPKAPVLASYPLVDDEVVEFTTDHEEPVPHFYKDTKDKITIGIGFNVNQQPKKAYDLGLYWAEGEELTSRRASEKDIRNAFEKIESLRHGRQFPFYDPIYA